MQCAKTSVQFENLVFEIEDNNTIPVRFGVFLVCGLVSFNSFYQTAHQKLIRLHTLSPTGPTFILLFTGNQSVTESIQRIRPGNTRLIDIDPF